jgi:hypothetical protein
MIVGVSGAIGAGKDVIAHYLEREHGFTIVRFSDALKDEVVDILPRTLGVLWRMHTLQTGEPSRDELQYLVRELKPLGVRELLQEWGTQLRRREEPGYWVRKWHEHAHRMYGARIVTPDVRFKDEADAVRQRGGQLIRVVRPGRTIGTHESEHGLDSWAAWDLEVVNDGTSAALEQQVEAWIDKENET